MTIEIKHWNGRILHTDQNATTAREALMSAVLRGAVLSGAVLRGAVLRDAVLSGAVLRGADLRDADLSGADLRDADLRDADLRGAVLSGADLSGTKLERLMADLPDMPDLDAQILAAVETSIKNGHDGLRMADWHTCDSTHCVAGWAIHLAGDAGRALEQEMGPSSAGALIYHRNGLKAPNFFETNNDVALADLRARAKAAVGA